ncbi:hypothetical protein J7K18_02425 [bacterium]|nr:hypothetical protein [bacterium]
MKRVALILAMVFTASALYSGISVSTEVSRSEITIGDTITYVVHIEYDTTLSVEPPSAAENLGQFEIRDFNISEPETLGSKVKQEFAYIISTFDIGEFEIPPIGVLYKTTDDTTLKAIMTQPVKITVNRISPENATEIKDVKDPESLPFNYRKVIIISTTIIVALLVVGFVLYYIKRKRKRVSMLGFAAPHRPPDEVALERLLSLDESELLKRKEYKQFFTQLSDILREYLEARFDVPALESTTSQLLQLLADIDEIDRDVIDNITQILQLSDLVKFAKYIPLDEEVSGVIDDVRSIIEQTKREKVVDVAA